MSGETEVRTLINTIDQNASQNNVQHNTHHFEETVEPYAIDVLMKCCTICRCSKEYRLEDSLKKHFMAKHMDVPVEYAVVKSKKSVKCSACGIKLRTKKFIKHIGKVHARHLTENISQNEAPNDVNQNESQPEGIEEPYAIDVPIYNCRLCKVGSIRSMTKTRLNIHFEVKHNNAPPDFDVVKCDKRVECSSCTAEMLTKNFIKHKRKVHAGQFSKSISQNKLSNNVHQNTSQPGGTEETYTIDILMKRCKICEAEYAGEKYLKKHFEVKHKDVPMEFVVAKSKKFVRCSGCRVQIKKKNVVAHMERCVHIHFQTPINISSQKGLQINELSGVSGGCNRRI